MDHTDVVIQWSSLKWVNVGPGYFASLGHVTTLGQRYLGLSRDTIEISPFRNYLPVHFGKLLPLNQLYFVIF